MRSEASRTVLARVALHLLALSRRIDQAFKFIVPINSAVRWFSWISDKVRITRGHSPDSLEIPNAIQANSTVLADRQHVHNHNCRLRDSMLMSEASRFALQSVSQIPIQIFKYCM